MRKDFILKCTKRIPDVMPELMDKPDLIFIILCSVGLSGVLLVIISALLVPHFRMQEELSEPPILTSFPFYATVDNIHFCVLLTRLSIYSNFVVIKALGRSRLIRFEKMEAKVFNKESNPVIHLSEKGYLSEIILAVDKECAECFETTYNIRK